jgi:hypothetical protein
MFHAKNTTQTHKKSIPVPTKYHDKKISRKNYDTDTQQSIPFQNGSIWYKRTNLVVIALVDYEEDHGSNPIKVYLF